MNSSNVKLIFIDGPLEGQTKYISKRELNQSRTYRVYVPLQNKPVANSNLKDDEVFLTCIQIDYISFPIPSSYGTERFIMCQQNGGLGN